MSNKQKLILIAAGGHAAEILSYVNDLLTAGAPIELLGAIDDGQPIGPWESTRILGGMEVINEIVSKFGPSEKLNYLTCVGNNNVRYRLVSGLQAHANHLEAWSLIHPTAHIGRRVTIGSGTLLAPHAVVTTRVSIGQHCILNARSSVHHDCTIGDYVNINPAATICGSVKIGDNTFVGAGATVINGKTIGQNVIIGAGAVVTRDVPDDVTVVGVPARVIRKCDS